MLILPGLFLCLLSPGTGDAVNPLDCTVVEVEVVVVATVVVLVCKAEVVVVP